MGNKIKDLTGERFGKLTVVKYCGVINHRAVFECKCDCGNTKVVQGQLLIRGNTKSCGCLQKETPNATKHGLRNTHLYGVWCTMKSRCNNENSKHYALYGGRGITVCHEWQKFEPFYNWAIENGYKEGLTLDRIDVNGNYEPSNCRWVDVKTQQNNRRNNRLITYNGETKTLAQWADEKGISKTTLHNRLTKSKWSVEKALNTP